MRRLTYIGLFLLALSFIYIGCSQRDEPTLGPSSQSITVFAPSQAEQVVIANYDVQLDSRVFDGTHTTFTWTVSGTGVGPALTHFTLEIPTCAGEPTAYSPVESVAGGVGLNDIKWNIAIGVNDSEQFTLTFAGDIPLGQVHAEVRSHDVAETGIVFGPCGGFEISGTVFVDADSSGVQTGTESGVENVTVRLTDSNSNVHSMTTDALGNYSFRRLEGTYTVQVDLATPENDFNETLAEDFVPSTDLSQSVTVGPDSPNNDFGFQLLAKKIINDFEVGALTSTGQDAKYWKDQLRKVSKGQSADYTAVEILGFLATVQGYFIPDPYVFSAGNEIQDAMAILSVGGNDPLDKLKKALLTTELNTAAGLGVGDLALQLSLINWGEALVKQSEAQATGGPLPEEFVFGAPRTEDAARGGKPDKGGALDEAVQMFDLVNNTGGSGGGGG